MHYKNTNYVGTDQKRCSTCKEIRPLDEYTKSVRDGYGSQCRKCASARVMVWARANRERACAASRRSKAKHSEEIRIQQKAFRVERAKIAGTGPLPHAKNCSQCLQNKPLTSFRKNKVALDGRNTVCCACNAARVKRWRDTRRDKERELERARYRANPEKARGSKRRWNARNSEKIRVQNRKRYEENTEQAIARARQWQRAHPEQVNERVRKRNARISGLPGSHTLEDWKALCAKFQHRCVCCGASGKLTRDHIIPVTHPESSEWIENIQPLCRSCNAKKSNRDIVDYRFRSYRKLGPE